MALFRSLKIREDEVSDMIKPLEDLMRSRMDRKQGKIGKK